ncbi:ATP-binding cassette domain-containing protein [Staphylococcus lugdunensis]|uniref:peptidase domain-containing ABC transporter n=1 Tax=Staphylococcus lugdunensis TaxID=28035 RepID=UPI001F4CB406|nr:ATP-binding cassette domain-containing protein [Staphylococcus lugdunensis]MCH8646887.1 ATP-binding cassette domain-containing protein [Staphylococcus lugdunensis]
MSKYKVINQFEDYDCASAAVCMFLYEYEKKLYSLSEIKILLNTTHEGTSIKNIYTFLNDKGYKANVFKATKDIAVFEEIKPPFITQVYRNENLHYVTVYEISNNKVIYGDPLKTEIQATTKRKFIKNWNPYILSSSLNIELANNQSIKQNILQVFSLIKKNYKYTIPVVLLSLVSYVITLLLAGMYTLYFDNVIPNKAIFLIVEITGIYISIAILQLIFEIIKSKLTIKFGNSLNKVLIKKLMINFFKVKYDIVSKLESGELVTRFSQIDHIRERIVSISLTIPINILIIISTTIILLNRSFYLSLIIFIPMILYLLIYLFSKEKYEDLSFKLYKESEKFNIDFIESLDNITTIKSHNMSDVKSNSLNRKLKDLINITEKFGYYDAIITTIRNSIQTIFTILLFSVGAYLIIIDNLAEGEFLMFNALVLKILDPFTEIVNLQSQLQQGIVAQNKFDDILLATKENNSKNQFDFPSFNNLRIKKLNYSYGINNNKVLKNLDLIVENGEKIAIIGGNGNGKTTLAKIIAGLVVDYDGDLIINGVNYEDINDIQKREMVSFISEHVEIFSGTILENIYLGENNNKQFMKRIFNSLDMEQVLSNLPQKEYTLIGENGKTLSKGQSQLLNICRAYNKNSILHIYDEATSGLDMENKDKIEDFLLKEKTTKIFITHDSNFAKRCTKIFLLQNGQLKEINKNQLR